MDDEMLERMLADERKRMAKTVDRVVDSWLQGTDPTKYDLRVTTEYTGGNVVTTFSLHRKKEVERDSSENGTPERQWSPEYYD